MKTQLKLFCFESSFQTFGIENVRIKNILEKISILFWFFIPAGFFIIALVLSGVYLGDGVHEKTIKNKIKDKIYFIKLSTITY